MLSLPLLTLYAANSNIRILFVIKQLTEKLIAIGDSHRTCRQHHHHVAQGQDQVLSDGRREVAGHI